MPIEYTIVILCMYVLQFSVKWLSVIRLIHSRCQESGLRFLPLDMECIAFHLFILSE